MKTIAVVGGSGFLGRHVVTALQHAGFAVRVLSRRSGFDALHLNDDSIRALCGADAVVNLAGIKRETGGQTFAAVHVQLVRTLVDAMKTAGIRRLIHISVVVARPSRELPYHDTKWKGEEIIRASGLDYTILRPGVIYGEGDDMLSHLTLMIGAAPIFPIVGKGTAPMRPVHVSDVASAVVATLTRSCSGKTYDIVGPDRLQLREVVRVVADAMNLPSLICPTPVVLMRVPVRIMEAVMKQPLSTSAQLAMLAEGLDGAPGPARAELGLSTAPFTATRIRRLLRAAARTAPLDLRLFSAGAPRREITGASFGFIVLFAIGALSVIFGAASDRWMGMTIAMGLAVIGAMFIPAVRRRLKPSLFQIAAGAGTGIALYGITLLVVAFFSEVWPQWETAARTLYAWRNGHSALFLAPTLALIVFAEEVVWRGVVTRFLMERWGRMPGIALAALIYALAHWATFNPLLLLAALGCGLYWGWLFAATDNLIGPIVAHLLWDAFMVFLFPVVR